MNILNGISTFRIADTVQILLLSMAIYVVLRFIRNTRGVGILRGLFTFLIAASLVIGIMGQLVPGGLDVVRYIVSVVAPYFAIIVVILFQEEIRQGVSRFGHSNLLRFTGGGTAESPTEIAKVATSAKRLANSRTGALIAFERGVSLKPFVEGAVALDLPITSILLETIFFDGGPMHDGAVVVRGKRITAACCVFPLTANPDVDQELGTRHRAAIGLSERTDAVVLVVSEERGKISLAAEGKLHRDIPQDQLERRLAELLKAPAPQAEEEASGAA
jgi:diadenylate cyclase